MTREAAELGSGNLESGGLGSGVIAQNSNNKGAS
jgi:hypothetical protein